VPGNPLDLLAANHRRRREASRLLGEIAASMGPDPAALQRLRAWLRDELPAHVADEEVDLFPLLRARAAPEDEIGPTLEALSRDRHAAEAGIAAALEAIERLLAAPGPPAPEERARLAKLAESERHHLIVENAILLPLARVRLTPEDLEGMRRRMLERRGRGEALGE
jgi:iron-sulfur cluster repair protein YtfE (RIC family)